MTVRRRSNGKWIVDIDFHQPDGSRQRLRKTSPVQTKRGAEQYERQLRDELLAGTYQQRKEEQPTFAEFAEEWFQTYVKTNNKHSECLTKRSVLNKHLLTAFGNKKLADITMRHIERYKAQKLAGGLSPKSINNHLTILRRCLATAEEWGLLDTIPRVKWLKVPPPDFDFLDFAEADRLLGTAQDEPEWYPAVLTALRTGLRQGELFALRWQDVDLVAKKLQVRQAIWKGHISTPKTNRHRAIPLTDEVVQALKSHRHLKGELVFCQADGAPFTQSMVRWPLRRFCRKAGLRYVQWHCLRHSFASHLVMRGASIRTVQELLGHSTIQMTMRYAHLAPAALREAIELLEQEEIHGTMAAQQDNSRSKKRKLH